MSESVTLTSPRRLGGEVRVPGDKSVSHRAFLLAALAEGEGWIIGANPGADVAASARLVAALGVHVEQMAVSPAGVDYRVGSPGAAHLHTPAGVIDCANSGTTLRLGAGLLAGLGLAATLDGDASLRRRPVGRIITPLRAMGAIISASDNDTRPPLVLAGGVKLGAIDYTTPIPSAQVKSAILLAALSADGTTTVREAVATRDHTERMLRARGVPVTQHQEGGLTTWRLAGGTPIGATYERVPGDISSAAFWLVAASIHPDAVLTLRGIGVNPTRRAIIDLLLAMGADITVTLTTRDDGVGEPVADLTVRSSELHAIEVSPAETAAAIDEIPVLALAASQGQGTTVIRGAGELRHKESDRLTGIDSGLTALGAQVAVVGDDLHITGPTALHGAVLGPAGDHRLALTYAVAGLVARGETTVLDADCVAVSYPSFFTTLEELRQTS